MPRLATLGGLALVGEDGPLIGAAARGRTLAVLAILARADEAGVAREKLAAMLWPESDEERARHSLGQALYTLRRALGADALLTGGASVALDRRVIECDVVAFMDALETDDLRRATDLYAGPFLDGFHLSGAAEFERWVDAERDALHRRYTAALESLAGRAAESGDDTAAVGFWRRLAAAEPLSSRVALGLMEALDRAGDRTGALQAAAVHEALVREELDAPPDPSVVDLAEALRRDPVRAAPTARTRDERSDAPAPNAARDATPSRTTRTTRWIGLAAAAILAITVARFVDSGSRTTAPGPDRTRIAVETFDNDTGDPAFDFLGRLAAEYIVDGLIRTGFVQVVEGGIGRDPDAVLAGRIYVVGDSIVFAGRLEHPDGGEVQRTVIEPIARTTDASGALDRLRQRLLGAVATLYDPRVASWSDATLRPPRLDAFSEFAAGVELISFPRDPQGAAARFRRAIEQDSEFMLPRLWLAWTWTFADYTRADSVARSLETLRGAMSPFERAWHDRMTAAIAGDNEASFQAAREMAGIVTRAGGVIALASTALDTNRPRIAVRTLREAGMDSLGIEIAFPWFLLTAAYHTLGEYEAELAATDEAIARIGLAWGFLGPGVPALAALGRLDELERRIDELQHVALEGGRPGGPTALATAVIELRAHGHAAQAAALFARLDSTPHGPDRSPLREEALEARMELLYELGRWDEAAQMHEIAPRTQRNDVALTGMEGLLAARREDRGTARRVADQLEAIDTPYLFGETTFLRARIEAVLGNHDRSIALLRQAFAEGLYGNGWYRLHVLRDFDPLRGLPAFRQLIAPRG